MTFCAPQLVDAIGQGPHKNGAEPNMHHVHDVSRIEDLE